MFLDSGVSTYKKRCDYCGSDFYVKNPQSNRVTCGQEACHKAHNLLSAKQAYRQKKGLKEQVKKCLYCQKEFISISDRFVTCGQITCKIKRSTDTQFKRLSIEKTCCLCGKVFKCLRRDKVQTARQRVTCGQAQCQKEYKQAYWQKPENKGLRAHYMSRNRAKLEMLRELERLAGII